MNAPTAVTSAGVHALVRGSRLMTVLAPMVVLACVVSARGSGAPESSAASALSGANGGSGEAAASGNSYPLPACTGQDPKTCSYDEFDPMVDGFSFATGA